ncbi:hypothetical protein M8494_27645 [Serratia ureilytica]
MVYSQRCKEAYKDVPIVLGGIEASLRRIAHYDYWSDTVRRSVLVDSKADMLIYGNGERPLVEVAHRLAAGEKIGDIHDIRNTAVMRRSAAGLERRGFHPPRQAGPHRTYPEPVRRRSAVRRRRQAERAGSQACHRARRQAEAVEKTYVLLPSFEKVKGDKVLYAHTSRILHHETNRAAPVR